MQLTETVKLYPNKYRTELIKATMTEYISKVNHLVLDAINGRAITKITTADVNALFQVPYAINVFEMPSRS